MLRMQIKLTDEEREALQLCATHERREMREQAAILIRLELERRGLLSSHASVHSEVQSKRTNISDGGQHGNS